MCKVKGDGTTDGVCHSIIDLGDFKMDGLSGKGCIADKDWISSIKVPYYCSISDPSLLLDIPNHKVRSIVGLEDGAHGVIEGGIRTVNNNTQRVFIKRAKTSGISLLQEALVQKVIFRSLVRAGFPNGAPDVYDIIALDDKNTVCFTMEPKVGVKLQDIIDEKDGPELSKLIAESLLQISTMLSHIVNDIGMNHRDLKPTNIIIIKRDKYIDRVCHIDNMTVRVRCNFDICFVDFGFSCIGIENGKGGGSLKISKEYPENDPCPKVGRDIYMFISFLYFYVQHKLLPPLDKLFKKWLNINGCNMTDYLRAATTSKEQRDILESIYTLCGHPELKELKSTVPEFVVRDLVEYLST